MKTKIPDPLTSRFDHLIGKVIEKGGAYFCSWARVPTRHRTC